VEVPDETVDLGSAESVVESGYRLQGNCSRRLREMEALEAWAAYRIAVPRNHGPNTI
jgi:hypothetical protein